MEAALNLISVDYDRMQQIQLFLVDHTTAIKVTRVVLDILGAGLVCAGLFSAAQPVFSLVISGIALVVVIEVAFFALRFLGFLNISEGDRPFVEGTYEKSRLYYKEGMPVLEIEADTHYDAGYAHGYLAGEGLVSMLIRLQLIVRFTPFGKRLDEIFSKNFSKLLKQIPKDYRDEIEGVVAGVNAKKNESWFARMLPDLTEPNIIALHYLSTLDDLKDAAPAAACSVILTPEEVGRNLDWPSMGVLGNASLMKYQKIGDGPGLCEMTIAGCCGSLTAVNEHGVFAAMNVTSQTTVKSPPTEEKRIGQVFFNRHLLEHARSAEEVRALCMNQDGFQPDAPYHLSVADRTDQFSCHFYQEDGTLETPHTIRSVRDDKPVVTLNATYSGDSESSGMYYHEQRKKNIARGLKKGASLTELLSQPYVNNELTIHSVVYQIQEGELHIALPSHSFSAKNPRVKFKTNIWA